MPRDEPGWDTAGGGRGSGRGGAERGVPDGLLVGVLGFLLGLTVLTWTATGLSGWLDHGRWPDGLSFPRTPLAMRELVAEPRDIAAAWRDVPAEQLSGHGLFWGVFIGQLMVLTVLAIFALGTLTRWRAVRAARSKGAAGRQRQAGASQPEEGKGATAPTVQSVPEPRPAPPAADAPEPRTAPAESAEPEAVAWGKTVPAEGTAPVRQTDASGGAAATPGRRPVTHGLLVGAPHGAAADAVGDAEGAVVVVTSDPELWSETAGARAKLGPVHVYDPEQLTEAPTRLRWAPHQDCDDMECARSRAAALLAPVRSPARSDEAVHAAAETLLRCWLHAAAVGGDPFRQVHRWALTGSSKDAVRILRTATGASSGAAGELEAVLTAYPERREAATTLVRRALGCVSRLHVRNACTPARPDRIAWESFVHEGGSLYLVGRPLEAPHRGDPAVMPLLTALTAAVVEHGRRMAARSSAGRLDPPLTLVLDHPATVAPFPGLPALLADGESAGLLTHALLRSEEQLRAWWPELAGSRS